MGGSDDETGQQTGQTRTRRSGQYVRTGTTADRDAEALRHRGRGLSYREIAREMGYRSPESVRDAVRRALNAHIPAEDAAEVRRLELARLDGLWAAATRVLERQHLTVSNGRVVRLGQPTVDPETGEAKIWENHGEPLPDDGPVLAAIDRLLKIQERRARLLGLDSPVKQDVNVDGALTYQVVGVTLEEITGIPADGG